ncbi:hypothetical protein JKP88DRAFT_353910 [Tribonema minus]|uniref:M23ase beta-sheet core domain-containing protein n=1 Tax=Tribonema minus TaxID=303371 RepID=A0A835Z4I5_9STRA|nr:hypothetical protein JKP88DRAFT_353910 [Tribonema minus]
MEAFKARYYHLAAGSACVWVGQRVEAGDIIARSGNTGYSSTPHLHFDVVDLLPERCCTLRVRPFHAGTATAPDAPTAVAAVAAARLQFPAVPAVFSGAITDIPASATLVDFDSWQQSAAAPAAAADGGGSGGVVLLLDRRGFQVNAVIVANTAAGPELFQMAGKSERMAVPIALISKEDGESVRSLLSRCAAEAALVPEDGELASKVPRLTAAGSSSALIYQAVTQQVHFDSASMPATACCSVM